MTAEYGPVHRHRGRDDRRGAVPVALAFRPRVPVWSRCCRNRTSARWFSALSFVDSRLLLGRSAVGSMGNLGWAAAVRGVILSCCWCRRSPGSGPRGAVSPAMPCSVSCWPWPTPAAAVARQPEEVEPPGVYLDLTANAPRRSILSPVRNRTAAAKSRCQAPSLLNTSSSRAVAVHERERIVARESGDLSSQRIGDDGRIFAGNHRGHP